MKLSELINSFDGFTLIELFIVIAIISMLAAIAIPNYISYRNNGYCAAAETDAENIIASISDYFADVSRYDLPDVDDLKGIFLSGAGAYRNTAILSGTIDKISVIVIDRSSRCPDKYQENTSFWNNGRYTKAMY